MALLRAEAGRDPHDRGLTDLVGELSTRSEEFRVRWAAHNVRFHRTGTSRFHHPVVGDLTLSYGPGAPRGSRAHDLRVHGGTNSPSQEALNLSSWASTPDQVAAIQADAEA